MGRVTVRFQAVSAFSGLHSLRAIRASLLAGTALVGTVLPLSIPVTGAVAVMSALTISYLGSSPARADGGGAGGRGGTNVGYAGPGGSGGIPGSPNGGNGTAGAGYGGSGGGGGGGAIGGTGGNGGSDGYGYSGGAGGDRPGATWR